MYASVIVDFLLKPLLHLWLWLAQNSASGKKFNTKSSAITCSTKFTAMYEAVFFPLYCIVQAYSSSRTLYSPDAWQKFRAILTQAVLAVCLRLDLFLYRYLPTNRDRLRGRKGGAPFMWVALARGVCPLLCAESPLRVNHVRRGALLQAGRGGVNCLYGESCSSLQALLGPTASRLPTLKAFRGLIKAQPVPTLGSPFPYTCRAGPLVFVNIL